MFLKFLEILVLGGFFIFLTMCYVLMGTTRASIKKEYNSEVLKDGIYKGAVLALFVIGSYSFALTPQIAAIQITNPVTENQTNIAEIIKWFLITVDSAFFVYVFIKAYQTWKLPSMPPIAADGTPETTATATDSSSEYAQDEKEDEDTALIEGNATGEETATSAEA